MQPILKIDLTTGMIQTQKIPAEYERAFLGGASLAARVLYEFLQPDLDPLSPQAPLLFLNGPLSGTAGPAVGRFVICGRSPATGLWGESNCGGFWGPELRKAGFDGVLLTGKSTEPVYIWIRDSNVMRRPAGHLWGLDTYSTQAQVLAELDPARARVATIGPAGEAKLPYALILTDHGRVAGRTGLGAVMGSKLLKAIAVSGSSEVPVHDPGAYRLLRSQVNRNLRSEAVSEVLRQLGTAGSADYFNYLGEMPQRYFSTVNLPEADQISGSVIADTILSGVSACHACVIACGRVVRLEDGQKRKGPEYETLVGFGPNLGLADPVFATRMGELCDRYGMDSISLSNTIGLVFKLHAEGRISENEYSGLNPVWGDRKTIEQLVHQTVRREGLGRLVAQGARALGRYFGAEEEAVQVNGLEVAYHDPRGATGMALVYATSTRGACHNQSDYFLVDIGQVEASLGLEYFDRQGGAEKAANVARHQDWRTVFNALVMCIFANLSPETVLELTNAACGLAWSLDDLVLAGERGWNLKRMINLRLGLTGSDDSLPEPLLRSFPDSQHHTGFQPDFREMRRAYYQARGWDPETGVPSRGKLAQLGLDFV